MNARRPEQLVSDRRPFSPSAVNNFAAGYPDPLAFIGAGRHVTLPCPEVFASDD